MLTAQEAREAMLADHQDIAKSVEELLASANYWIKFAVEAKRTSVATPWYRAHLLAFEEVKHRLEAIGYHVQIDVCRDGELHSGWIRLSWNRSNELINPH